MLNAWDAAVVLGVVFMVLFQRPIARMLDRVNRLKIGPTGGEAQLWRHDDEAHRAWLAERELERSGVKVIVSDRTRLPPDT